MSLLVVRPELNDWFFQVSSLLTHHEDLGTYHNCMSQFFITNLLYLCPYDEDIDINMVFPVGSMVKTLLQCRRHRIDPWARKIPWRRKWQPTPVFLPGKFRGQRSLVGYSPRGSQRVEHDLATEHDTQDLIWQFSGCYRNKNQ